MKFDILDQDGKPTVLNAELADVIDNEDHYRLTSYGENAYKSSVAYIPKTWAVIASHLRGNDD